MKNNFILLFILLSLNGSSQNKNNQSKEFTCSTFVYNLSLDEMKIRDICFDVNKGDFINLNDFSSTKRKEYESWRFDINIKDNKSLSLKNYKAAFYIYENSDDIIQYHPVVENEEFKAIIYNKRKIWLHLKRKI